MPQRAEKVKEAMEEYRALDHEDMVGKFPPSWGFMLIRLTDRGSTHPLQVHSFGTSVVWPVTH